MAHQMTASSKNIATHPVRIDSAARAEYSRQTGDLTVVGFMAYSISELQADLATAKADAWDEGHEQGYDSGMYARADDEPETVEGRSLEKNPYRTKATEGATP